MAGGRGTVSTIYQQASTRSCVEKGRRRPPHLGLDGIKRSMETTQHCCLATVLPFP